MSFAEELFNSQIEFNQVLVISMPHWKFSKCKYYKFSLILWHFCKLQSGLKKLSRSALPGIRKGNQPDILTEPLDSSYCPTNVSRGETSYPDNTEEDEEEEMCPGCNESPLDACHLCLNIFKEAYLEIWLEVCMKKITKLSQILCMW